MNYIFKYCHQRRRTLLYFSFSRRNVESSKLSVLRALLPTCFVPQLLSCFKCLVPYVHSCPTCLVSYVLSCPTYLVPYVLSCLTCHALYSPYSIIPWVPYCLAPCVLFVLKSTFVLLNALRFYFFVHLLLVIFLVASNTLKWRSVFINIMISYLKPNTTIYTYETANYFGACEGE